MATHINQADISQALRDTLRIDLLHRTIGNAAVIMHSSRALTGCVPARRRVRQNQPAYTIYTRDLNNLLHDRAAGNRRYAIGGTATRRA